MAIDRRRRRPLLPIVAMVLTVGVGLAYLTRDRHPDGPDPGISYLDEVRPVVDRSNRLGADVDDLLDTLTAVERPVVARRLDRMRRDANSVLDDVTAASAPDELRGSHALLVATMALRARGVEALKPAVDAVLGGAPVEQAVAQMAEVGEDLVLADRNYEVFVEGLPDLPGTTTPESVWVGNPARWEPQELGPEISTLRASTSLTSVHDVAIVTLRTDPPPTGKDGALDVLPFTRNLRVQVVVANVGNEEERRVTVMAALTMADGTVDDAVQFVNLAPGQRVTVQLGGLNPTAGQTATLVVRIEPRPGETSVTDNEQIRTFAVR
jgi:hypothetical protein